MSRGEFVLATVWNLAMVEGIFMEFTNVIFARRMEDSIGTNGFSRTMMKRDLSIEVVRLVGLSFFLFVGVVSYFSSAQQPATPVSLLNALLEFGLILGGFSLVLNANLMHFGNRKLRRYAQNTHGG